METQKTIAILKPTIPEEEFGEKSVITREKFRKIFERVLRMKGLNIQNEISGIMTKQKAEEHYSEKREHPLFESVIKYMTSDVSNILSIQGDNSIIEVRKLALKMREKYIGNNSKLYNMIHASDSTEESDKEHFVHFGIQKKQS